MTSWFRQLDDLLRGHVTVPERLAEGRIDLSLRRFVLLAVLLGACYGFFMGWYAISVYWGGGRTDPQRCWQIVASMVKLPALFLLTLVVTFPSLYVFNALVGCRLSFGATLRLLVAAVAVNVAVAASLGTILGFFTLSTTSYPFMVLLNVALLGMAGFVALAFLLHTLRRLAAVSAVVTKPPRVEPVEDAAEGVGAETPKHTPGPLDQLPKAIPPMALGQAKLIFQIWVILYGLVGAQMGWLLRPFIGNPGAPFEWFRARSGNFFLAVMGSIQNLFGAQ